MIALGCLVASLLPVAALADTHSIDIQHSRLTVHVYKSGLFAFAAHDHEINAPIVSGEVNDPLTSVTLSVATARMSVDDPHGPAGDRPQVQERMLGPDVLDTAHFPSIDFKSTGIAAAADGWDVSGQLTIHGVTRAVRFHVTRTNGHYTGSTTLKQTDFGIQPVTIAGGTVKVKDEIRIDFDIIT